jgi:hypothetical protein
VKPHLRELKLAQQKMNRKAAYIFRRQAQPGSLTLFPPDLDEVGRGQVAFCLLLEEQDSDSLVRNLDILLLSGV